jgi:two-component sensor histidine kinase
MLDQAAPITLPAVPVWRRGWIAEILVAAAATTGAVAARVLVEQVVGGVAPFVLSFPAVMIATLVGGGRTGAIAAICCQLLTIRYVFPNWVAPHGDVSTDLANVVLSTLALAGTIWATASYRRTAASLRSRCEQQVRMLTLLNAEMDHRTKNNYQVAAGLLAHQSLAAFDPAVARELDAAAARLETIASVYQGLPAQVDDTGSIDLADHLDRVVSLVRSGAFPDAITLHYRADPIQVAADVAVVAGLIVNEWLTNALKHAFGGGPGRIVVDLVATGAEIRVRVSDDGEIGGAEDDSGAGRPEKGGPGRGSDLMRALAHAIHAEITIAYQGGTRCQLLIPIAGGKRVRPGGAGMSLK